MFSIPSKVFKEGYPRIESSQNLILKPFPGIQVRLEEIKFKDLRQRGRIGEPFLVLGGWSRHLSLCPLKYFVLNALELQVVFPLIIFQRIFPPMGKF